MFAEFFGNYLLNKGIVNTDDLQKALDEKAKVRLKIGTIAINKGYMTPKQVKEVNELQKNKDKYFGQLAIEKGYLKKDQLDNLLNEQKSDYLLLAQALIDEDIMDMETFKKEVSNYKDENDLSDNAFEKLKNGKAEFIIDQLLEFDKDKEFFSKYVKLFYKNIIRFIDVNTTIKEIKKYENEEYRLIASQKIKKEDDTFYFTGIAGDVDSLLKISGLYAEEIFNEISAYSKDSLGEFLNLNNGLFSVNMSDEDIDLALSVQEINTDVKLDNNLLHIVPFKTSFGTFDLVIGIY
ncbi:MAG: hypothetical protein ACQEQE_07960 [Bacillota bacterium]